MKKIYMIPCTKTIRLSATTLMAGSLPIGTEKVDDDYEELSRQRRSNSVWGDED